MREREREREDCMILWSFCLRNEKFAQMNPSNGIPIKSWLKNPEDTQLRHLFELVKELVFSPPQLFLCTVHLFSGSRLNSATAKTVVVDHHNHS